MAVEKYLGINIDKGLDATLDEHSLKLLKGYYCLPTETSPQQAFARAAVCYCFGDYEFAQRIYDYVSKGWFMFASPVLSNAVEIKWPSILKELSFDQACEWLERSGVKFKGLPISCFLTFVDDSIEGLIDHTAEERWLSVKGGGVGGHWSKVRSTSDITPGPISFLHTVDADMTAYRQGSTRRGSYAAYLDSTHPDINEFVNMRVPSGDINRKNLNIHHGVNIDDEFISKVKNGGTIDLKEPHNGEIVDTVEARDLWSDILTTRFRTGEPYLNQVEEANRRMPYLQQLLGLKINGSNLCNEIHLATSEDRTAVCCLSSTNLEFFDEWSQTEMIKDLIQLLDNVLEVFIRFAPPQLHKAIRSAKSERALGLGSMGFHYLLQRRGVPWESALAKSINMNVFSYMQNEARVKTKELGELRGCCPDMRGTGIRNSHFFAIAPNANSSILIGTSPSIEPMSSNVFTHKTRAGSHLVVNKYLRTVLKNAYIRNPENIPHDNYDSEMELWMAEILAGINANNGSVQHLDFLSDYEKDTFKTAFEINQHWVVQHARDRQEFICQGQSVNLFFSPDSPKAYVHAVHLRAFDPDEEGRVLKGLYYLRTKSLRKAENVDTKVEANLLVSSEMNSGGVEGECLACEG